MEKNESTNSKTLIIVAVVILILIVAGAAWYFTSNKTETPTPTSSATPSARVFSPKNADWAVYKSSKYGFSMAHPVEYTLTETADKSIKLNKGETPMVEMTSLADVPIDVNAKLYTDATKGYMTGATEKSTTIAGTTGKMISGTFGKNAGVSKVHDGIKGSVTIFIQNGRTWEIFSYDNGDATAIKNFEDIAYDLTF